MRFEAGARRPLVAAHDALTDSVVPLSVVLWHICTEIVLMRSLWRVCLASRLPFRPRLYHGRLQNSHAFEDLHSGSTSGTRPTTSCTITIHSITWMQTDSRRCRILHAVELEKSRSSPFKRHHNSRRCTSEAWACNRVLEVSDGFRVAPWTGGESDCDRVHNHAA